MNWSKKIWFIIFSSLSAMACQRHAKTQSNTANYIPVELRHAKGFEIFNAPDHQLLKIYRLGEDSTHFDTYKLVSSGVDQSDDQHNVIPTPCKRIICLSSTQLTYFFALDALQSIAGTNSSRHLFHEEMNRRLESGLVKRVGKEGHFNVELITAINPDVIFVSPFKAGGFDALKNLGFNLVPMAAYAEETPLGRAEWIKMIASFIGEESRADSIFSGITQRYDALKSLTSEVDHRPTVFSGKLRSGTWYVPGGESFYAHYFRDAGADYIIKDKKKAAYPLDFETMYAKAGQCDFWRILVPEEIGFNRKSLLAEDGRYADFKAFQEGNILMCNIREKPYYEQNAMKPDSILADYIHFFHPELLPDYEPVFYQKLN